MMWYRSAPRRANLIVASDMGMSVTIPDQSKLPEIYRPLPFELPLSVPGFSEVEPSSVTFAPAWTDMDCWFRRFLKLLHEAVEDRRWLPVCRMSDGEFIALFGTPPPSPRHAPGRRVSLWARNSIGRLRRRGRLEAATLPGTSSGSYSYRELRELRNRISADFAQIAVEGILAVHLSYGPEPFVEHFFPRFKKWLRDKNLTLTLDNYIPFYFVYAALSGYPSEIMGGRRVGIVHGATGEKRSRVEVALSSYGAESVLWHEISTSSSAFDLVSSSAFDDCDLILVGAGIGKARVFAQLRGFGGPCIDAGFMFEVWADPALGAQRLYCLPDRNR